MESNSKKNKKSIVFNIIIVFFLLVFVTSIVFIVINDVKTGWNGIKTIRYSFAVIAIICSISMFWPWLSFLISNNSAVIKSNNELFLAIENAERLELLSYYQNIKDNEAKDKKLREINNYIVKKCPNSKELTHSSLVWFMKWKKYSKKPYSFSIDDTCFLIIKYKDYCQKYSKKYQKLLSSYKSGEITKRYPFPLFSTIMPLLFSFASFFAIIYQDVAVADNLTDSLLSYFFAFITFTFYTFTLILLNSSSVKETILKRNNTITNELMDLIKSKERKLKRQHQKMSQSTK